MTEYTESAKIDILKQALIDNRYTDVIDSMRPDSTISINPSQMVLLIFLLTVQMTLCHYYLKQFAE